MEAKKDNFVKKVAKDLAESTKMQHQITKANFQTAKAEFSERHAQAKKSPRIKQQEQLAEAEARRDEAIANAKKAKGE